MLQDPCPEPKIPTKTHNYSASEPFGLSVLRADLVRAKVPRE